MFAWSWQCFDSENNGNREEIYWNGWRCFIVTIFLLKKDTFLVSFVVMINDKAAASCLQSEAESWGYDIVLLGSNFQSRGKIFILYANFVNVEFQWALYVVGNARGDFVWKKNLKHINWGFIVTVFINTDKWALARVFAWRAHQLLCAVKRDWNWCVVEIEEDLIYFPNLLLPAGFLHRATRGRSSIWTVL